MTGEAFPTITVVVPVYNVAAYIGDAICSLQEQTFSDFEVIMVDDGSTDGSLDVARDLVAGDARFRFLRQENAGPASARNRAFEVARGEYIVCLDADDSLTREAFARLVSFARQHDLDYLDFSAHTIYESNDLREVRDESFYEGRRDIDGVMSGPELFCAFQRNREYCCALWLHFFKRDLLGQSSLMLKEGLYVHEDELFSPLLIARAKRAAFLNEPLYVRRVRGRSAMTSGRSMRNVASMHEVVQELYAWMKVHAVEFDGAFRAAWAQRIAELRELACADACSASVDELVAYSEGLPPAEQFDFELDVVQGMLRRAEFYGSTTWRVGEALLALPKAAQKLVM